MFLRQVAAATVLALTGSTLVAGPATARPEAERRDGTHYPFTYQTTILPGTFGMVATPPLPPSAEMIKVTVKTKAQADQEEKDLFDELFTRIGQMKRKQDRLLTCLRFHVIALQDEKSEAADFTAENASLAILLLAACLQAAGILEREAPPPGTSPRALAARKCAKDGYGLPAKLRKTEGGWRIAVDGEPKDLEKPRIKTTCRVKGHRVTYKVRPAKKGKTLKQVVGRRFGLGLELPSDASKGVPVKITFATP